MPPAPGQSGELPPGFLTGEAKAAKQRSDRRRKRLSLALGLVVLIVAVLATLAITAQSNKKTTVADAEVGECFNGDDPNDISTVDCEEQHQFELFAVAQAPDPSIPFPGDETVRTDGGSICQVEFVAYYGAPTETAVGNGLDIRPVAPTEDQWTDGDTETYCLVFDADGNALQGSMKGKGAG